ncbi:hypothetical protein ATN88_16490 [Enterovibrio coralii]|uniref:Uncharacterized protein n=1 Tax=Enterovibrio coralii TaxID=294935 RepID=A0A135I647_9GAMM|nr:hypothetical protein ATN88_16490 [Enterovibrio coralii]
MLTTLNVHHQKSYRPIKHKNQIYIAKTAEDRSEELLIKSTASNRKAGCTYKKAPYSEDAFKPKKVVIRQ